MATDLNITMKQYNGVDYDTLYPKTIVEQIDGLSDSYFTKNQTLKSSTANQFGLGSNAVPDNVLSFLGKYNEYWWSLLHGVDQSYYKQNETKNTSIVNMANTSKDSAICYWSRTLSFDKKTGSIGLSGTIASIQFNTTTNARIVAGLQQLVDISAESDFYMYTEDNQTIYHIPQNATCPSSGGPYSANYTFGCSSTNPVYGTENSASAISTEFIQVSAGETTYEHSTDRNAYPDSGTVDGVAYTYLGVPFEKFPTMPQIEIGSYTGTGTYGDSNPNRLTFEFMPKFVQIQTDEMDGSYAFMDMTLIRGVKITVASRWYHTYGKDDGLLTTNSVRNNVTWGNTFVEFYTLSSSASGTRDWFQMNAAGKTYHYVAIG